MKPKSIAILFLIYVLKTQSNDALMANCEFGPMEGIEGRCWKCLPYGYQSLQYATICDVTVIEDIFSFLVDVQGSALFYQSNPTKDLSIQVTGLKGLKSGKHGFHIHENGDCRNPGSHFNPEMVFFS